ncbi:hypothetical protein tb265_31060 [Gemmatimonadetes bacterium T265]|nr:hypothetical protein tb265_31060 [Gemmatimonadetes bacterium T265]
MQLDVIIATFNRHTLLARALASLQEARVPAGLDVQVTVVDNGSRDGTRAAVETAMAEFGGRLRYRYEGRVGKSYALNTGIAATDGDLVGMIDDDEEIDATWYDVVARAFADPSLDFVGGPYRPRWGAPAPGWLPPRPSSIVGWVAPSERVERFGAPGFNAMLMGGNAVIRRALLERAGPYSTALGPTAGQRLGSGEDHDMYLRLLAAGGRGEYRPDLIIHHYVPPARLRKGYHRRWMFWHAVSMSRMPTAHADDGSAGPRWLGVPRWVWGGALRGSLESARGWMRSGPAARSWERFDRELRWWDLAGRLYGGLTAPRPGPATLGSMTQG